MAMGGGMQGTLGIVVPASDILEAAKKSKININDHVSTQNQKAIERLLTVDLEILLQILSDNELLGF